MGKRTQRQIAKDDQEVLMFAGMHGHEFAGIFTSEEGWRKLGCEASSLFEAALMMTRRRTPRIYQRWPDNVYRLCWYETRPGKPVRVDASPADDSPVESPEGPDVAI